LLCISVILAHNVTIECTFVASSLVKKGLDLIDGIGLYVVLLAGLEGATMPTGPRAGVTNGDTNGIEMSVLDVVLEMSAAVKVGDFEKAETLGARAPFPLSVSKAAIAGGAPISQGAQAMVKEAIVDGFGKVAIKRAIIRESEDLLRFRKEVVLLSMVNGHPHIVKMLGARLLPPDYMVILQLEATNAANELYSFPAPARLVPGWSVALNLGAQLAAAVAHLHDLGIVHRDIKPANVLLSQDFSHCRLADLGIAYKQDVDERLSDAAKSSKEHSLPQKPSGGYRKRAAIGTLEYMAPEILMNAEHSYSSDVFALAITINELASGTIPYSDCTRDNPLAHTILEMGYGRQELAIAVAVEGLRPTVAAGAPPEVVALLKSCWDAVPQRRPSAATVCAQLRAAASRHSNSNSKSNSTLGGSKGTEIPASLGSLPLQGPAIHVRDGEALQTEHPPAWAAAQADHGDVETTRVFVGSFAAPGLRGDDRMEDRCIILSDMLGLRNWTLAAVFDGHRGSEAAQYLASNLEQHIQRAWSSSSSCEDLLIQSLKDADEAFRRTCNCSRTFPGSTATVAMFYNDRLCVANIGDSRAVMCRDGIVTAVTVDQTADREEERRRIVEEGGSVQCVDGHWRVGGPGLVVTRSIGDADLKSQGVTAEAEVTTIDLCQCDGEDNFLILATDGVWDVMSAKQAVDLVHDTVKQPAMCARRLVTEAIACGSRDNVTAIVAFFSKHGGIVPSTVERVYHNKMLKYMPAHN
jgi:serine/threonine protein phosphatase PrpC